ncbi:MAG: hypothetical protein IPN02_09960 [Candidatus Microthrix sp.]|uniref:Uncharacterized protein n=1 Tax=Candidatus Neomicrothrix subdominans TaxID=2954438 RepID=A0A936NBA2_9ACTN|nr:hypothetical protein [Candidatus Microthrix subdominans]
MTATVTPGASPDKVAARPMSDVDDVDHIMSAYDDDGWADDVGRAVELNADALFTWGLRADPPGAVQVVRKRPRPRSGTAPPTWTGASLSTQNMWPRT